MGFSFEQNLEYTKCPYVVPYSFSSFSFEADSDSGEEFSYAEKATFEKVCDFFEGLWDSFLECVPDSKTNDDIFTSYLGFKVIKRSSCWLDDIEPQGNLFESNIRNFEDIVIETIQGNYEERDGELSPRELTRVFREITTPLSTISLPQNRVTPLQRRPNTLSQSVPM